MFVRLASGLCLIAALIALSVDGVRSLAASDVLYTTIGELWAKLHPASFHLAEAAAQPPTDSFAWQTLLYTLLHAPVPLVFLMIGAGLFIAPRLRGRLPRRVTTTQQTKALAPRP